MWLGKRVDPPLCQACSGLEIERAAMQLMQTADVALPAMVGGDTL